MCKITVLLNSLELPRVDRIRLVFRRSVHLADQAVRRAGLAHMWATETTTQGEELPQTSGNDLQEISENFARNQKYIQDI